MRIWATEGQIGPGVSYYRCLPPNPNTENKSLIRKKMGGGGGRTWPEGTLSSPVYKGALQAYLLPSTPPLLPQSVSLGLKRMATREAESM